MQIEIWSDYGCFARPEMRVERVSYSVIPPTAAAGILRAIYWHPGVLYQICRIHVLSPIEKATMKVNERGANGTDVVQKTVRCLKNPHYIIDFTIGFCRHYIAHEFDGSGYDANGLTVSDRISKVMHIMERRIRKGQCAYQPCMGMSSYPLFFRYYDGPAPACLPEFCGTHDFDYFPRSIFSIPAGSTPCACGPEGICSVKQSDISFVPAIMEDGVIAIPDRKDGDIK